MSQPCPCQVLKFARILTDSKIRGVSGQQLLHFADVISSDDLRLMRRATEQDCDRIDLNEW